VGALPIIATRIQGQLRSANAKNLVDGSSAGSGSFVQDDTQVLFSSENFLIFEIIALSFLFDKHYSIIE